VHTGVVTDKWPSSSTQKPAPETKFDLRIVPMCETRLIPRFNIRGLQLSRYGKTKPKPDVSQTAQISIPVAFIIAPVREVRSEIHGRNLGPQFERRFSMLLLIIVLLLLFGGGGGYFGYSRWGRGGGMGIVGTVVLIALVLYFVGALR
jgi:hypothetical protein